jgi:hypothetical protein
MNTTHLQGIGSVKAKPAGEFKIGERMMWNYGGKTEVTGILSETKAFITFELTDEHGVWERRLKKDRMVAIG